MNYILCQRRFSEKSGNPDAILPRNIAHHGNPRGNVDRVHIVAIDERVVTTARGVLPLPTVLQQGSNLHTQGKH